MVPLSIKLSTPGGVFIRWSKEHAATYSYAYLRRRCPCAICRDAPPLVKTEPDPFPLLGKGPIMATEVSPIGHYAIQFNWNDGHAEGIYSYYYLQEICPCEDCRENNN